MSNISVSANVESLEGQKDIAETPVVKELEFKVPLDLNERKHFEKIIKSNKTSIAILRKQVMALTAYVKSLPETEESKALLESLTTL